MKYISSRGQSPAVSFEDALLAGLAPDGGLYMPVEWPQLSADQIAGFAGKPFTDVASTILQLFVGDSFTPDEVAALCHRAFSSFTHPAVTPLVQVGDEDWILELFHGPTLAFKDVAMQVLGEMFEIVLKRKRRGLTIVGATSGDTGGAAVEALKNKAGIEVFILHPEGRISEVQRRIMTTTGAPNVTNIAVEGTFDDCQTIVKQLFGDRDFVEEVSLGGVNSINWARIAVQSVYYFTAAAALGAPKRSFSFVVPTGNFGDIFAGFVAAKLGLPIERLCVATNRNDIVHRVLETGNYLPADVHATTSPSMDIQIASNFERLIFEMSKRNAQSVVQLMENQRQSGGFSLPASVHERMGALFTSQMAGEDEVDQSMRDHLAHCAMLIDPHTAVGRVAGQKLRQQGTLKGPVITLSTAHPAKFPDAVQDATGQNPALPEGMGDLFERKEQIITAPATPAAVKKIITSQR